MREENLLKPVYRSNLARRAWADQGWIKLNHKTGAMGATGGGLSLFY